MTTDLVVELLLRSTSQKTSHLNSSFSRSH